MFGASGGLFRATFGIIVFCEFLMVAVNNFMFYVYYHIFPFYLKIQ